MRCASPQRRCVDALPPAVLFTTPACTANGLRSQRRNQSSESESSSSSHKSSSKSMPPSPSSAPPPATAAGSASAASGSSVTSPPSKSSLGPAGAHQRGPAGRTGARDGHGRSAGGRGGRGGRVWRSRAGKGLGVGRAACRRRREAVHRARQVSNGPAGQPLLRGHRVDVCPGRPELRHEALVPDLVSH